MCHQENHESNSLVAGGGAVEAALSIHLEAVAAAMTSREQLAIAARRGSTRDSSHFDC